MMKIKNSNWFPVVLSTAFISVPIPALPPGTTVETLTLPQVAGSLLLLVTVIGVVYNLWKTTRAYGGLIGQGLRRFGFGIIFLVVEALDRIAQNFGSPDLLGTFVPRYYLSNSHDILLLLGLLFLALGFSKLSSAVKN
ncbi:MAG: hypothetical protein M1275_01915 [Patescibacteria group bacterium]|nr:hypothetical protein [Patescibacteria group bacterium]